MIRGFRRIAATAALLLLAPAAASAATKVRVEWLGESLTAGQPGAVLGAQSLSVTGSATPALSTAAPSFGLDQSGAPMSIGVARVTVISGAAVFAWGTSPVASESSGLRLQTGQHQDLLITTGQQVSVVEAADPPSSTPTATSAGPGVSPSSPNFVANSSELYSASFTRPANATPYAASAFVGNSTVAAQVAPLSWPNITSTPGQCATVTSIRVRAIPSGGALPPMVLYLYGAQPTAQVGDGATFVTQSASALQGFAQVQGTETLGSDGSTETTGALNNAVDAWPVCPTAGTTLYGYLATGGSYTPSSGATIVVELTIRP